MSGHSSWSSTRIGSREHGVVLQELFIAKKIGICYLLPIKLVILTKGWGVGARQIKTLKSERS